MLALTSLPRLAQGAARDLEPHSATQPLYSQAPCSPTPAPRVLSPGLWLLPPAASPENLGHKEGEALVWPASSPPGCPHSGSSVINMGVTPCAHIHPLSSGALLAAGRLISCSLGRVSKSWSPSLGTG